MERYGYDLIEDRKGLARMALEVEGRSVLGVDLESDSMYHYKEKVCLLQISSEKGNYVVDTLAVKDLSVLKPVFADSSVRKIFHAADNDIRALHRDFKIEVSGLFDTQVAARFLGARETGLASLLKERLGVNLEKKYQRKDWSLRPLKEEMLIYAVRDAFHLLRLSRILEDELKGLGRFSFVEEECGILSKVRINETQPGPLFLKFRGAGGLDGRSLAVLEHLLVFRDRLARKLDLPPFKVMGSGPIMEMVRKKPVDIEMLESMKGLSQWQIKKFGQTLIKTVQYAIGLPNSSLPVYPKMIKERPGRKVVERMKMLRKWREHKASRLGIEPSLVCPTPALHAIAVSDPAEREGLKEIRELRDWQVEEFGREICEIVNKTS